MNQFQIVNDDSPEANWVHNQLLAHNVKIYKPAQRKPFCLISTNEVGLTGGIKGFMHWSWLYISHLWVEEKMQGQGLGRLLIEKTIEWAREQNAKGLYVDTFSEEARQFYLKNGFIEMGKIPQFPEGFTRYFFYRSL